MHVMFLHPNFPAQFGHVAAFLSQELNWPCTFVTSVDTTHLQLPFNHVNYRLGDAPPPRDFYNPASLQGLMDHLSAVYAGLRGAPQLRPDLVVGHMSYGTMLYLRNLYACPFVGYFELLPPPFWTDALALRKEFPPPEEVRLFNATYHTLTYLHLHAVDAVWTPTQFQRDMAPPEFRSKMHVIYDGVDAEFFHRRSLPRPTEFRGLRIGPDTRVVTYASPGLESVRGFDIFMRVAKQVYRQFDDVLFLVAGEERTNHGHELFHLGDQSFKQYVLGQDDYDLDRVRFLGPLPPEDLATLYNLSDLHVYLTVPYTVSASLPQAMASECVVLGSATAPVQEMLDAGAHGLLADFYDVDGLATQAVKVLRDPGAYRPLGVAARERVLERYERTRCLNELVRLFEGLRGQAVDQVFAQFGKEGPP